MIDMVDKPRKVPEVFCSGCRRPVPYRGAKTFGEQKLWHCPSCYQARLRLLREAEREIATREIV